MNAVYTMLCKPNTVTSRTETVFMLLSSLINRSSEYQDIPDCLFFLPDCLQGLLRIPFLLSYSVFSFIFSLFFRFWALH